MGMWKVGLSVIIGIIVLGVSLNISAEEGLIPSWIKNTASFWVDGDVGDSEFISSLQYLINQDIIKIPITQVIAASANIDDNDRAMSIVVHFSDGEFKETLTIYTFSTFFHFSVNIDSNKLDATSGFEKIPAFSLQSLPSKDKFALYDMVNRYINPTRPPEPFAVNVDIVSGDGTVIQTWDYRKCNINDYTTFVDWNKENYRFSDIDDIEIRELFVFDCRGFSLL